MDAIKGKNAFEGVTWYTATPAQETEAYQLMTVLHKNTSK